LRFLQRWRILVPGGRHLAFSETAETQDAIILSGL